jgi:hypothetical protein
MDTFTHDDCCFAPDDSAGACGGEMFMALGAPFSVEPGLPYCERHSALL